MKNITIRSRIDINLSEIFGDKNKMSIDEAEKNANELFKKAMKNLGWEYQIYETVIE